MIEKYFKNIENAITDDALRVELKEIQKYVHEFEKKIHWYECILNALDKPVSVTDLNKNMTFLNQIGLTILNKKREEVIGKYCGDVWNLDICNDSQCCVERLKRCEAGGRSEFQLENSIYSNIASYIKDIDGNKIGHISVVTDITTVRDHEQQMRQSEEMHKAKDKMFSVVSHDMRSAMGSLISILRLTIENDEDAELKTVLLQDATAQLEKNFEMVDNLLCWAKSQMQGIVATPSFFEIQEESHNVTDRLQNMAVNKQIALINHIEKQQIYADRDMFHVILRNLTTNALKFTSSGGEVTLTSELKDNMLIIAVKDTGTGMSAQVREKLFKLSESNSSYGTNGEKGTGLGLILCADFVKTIGGKIWLTSEERKGTTFYFSIPTTN